ncbi:hypothetical protein [Ramlibacter sp.]|uniref:hypothetical protein n=1 Tax=Ramlibacter sp. TaxID=1917967 RepID=UPI003D0C54A3
MPFSLIGKSNAKLTDVSPQSMKLGQQDLKPAIVLGFKYSGSNREVLNMLDATLLPFLYLKNSAAATQGALDGIPVVSDMPQLSDAAKKMGGVLKWDDEQTGCKLIVYQGATGAADLKYVDCTRSIQKVVLHEGGTVDVHFTVYTATDIDEEAAGAACLLLNHEMPIELTLPDVLTQQQTLEEDDADDENTPVKALAASVGKGKGRNGAAAH